MVTGDGRHSTLGRHSDPSDEEISQAGQQLDGLGIAGWLAVSEGEYYGRGSITLLKVRRITEKNGDWAVAERLWQEQRARVNR
ncbi:hypothetical protein [Herbaspirillum huttiense]|uniref:hypothetical protein n=1 Tax=Herbaspirillum huttiense TaxID=863372 RepID=UPI003B3AC1B0